MKRILLAVLAVLLSVPALAVTPTPGQWDTAQQPVTYPVIGSNGVYAEHLGDGTTHGGLPPAFAWQLPDIPAPVIDTRQITEGPGTGNFTAGDNEGKFRFTLYGSHLLPDDPLRNHCQRGASHIHELLGSDRSGACSTFAQLRNAANTDFAAGKRASTNPGKNINASPYWHPGLEDCGAMSAAFGAGTNAGALGDGVCRFKKTLAVPLYYEIDNGGCGTDHSCLVARAQTYVDFPMGIGYVNIKNMDDPWNLKVKAQVAAANAANLAAGGSGAEYQIISDGFIGWSCITPGGAHRDGPYDNTDDLTCVAGDTIYADSAGAMCWDGHNTYSPSGYDHVVQAIRVDAKATVGGSIITRTDVCPVNGFKIARLINKPQWILGHSISSGVANDSPFLASDAGFQAKARADASRCVTATSGASSATVCAPAGASTFVCKAGCSWHFDYFQAWQKKYIRRASRHCLGTPWTDPSETGAMDADQTTLTVEPCLFSTLSTDTGTESALTQLTGPTTADVDGLSLKTYYPTPVPKGHMGPGTMHP